MICDTVPSFPSWGTFCSQFWCSLLWSDGRRSEELVAKPPPVSARTFETGMTAVTSLLKSCKNLSTRSSRGGQGGPMVMVHQASWFRLVLIRNIVRWWFSIWARFVSHAEVSRRTPLHLHQDCSLSCFWPACHSAGKTRANLQRALEPTK